VDADFVSEQARAVLEDMPVQAFKLGVLGSVENIEVIAEIISDYPHIPVVVDPVVASGRGDELASRRCWPAANSSSPGDGDHPQHHGGPAPAPAGDDGDERSMSDCARAAGDGLRVRADHRLPRQHAPGG
jgi:hydroxymethylpyrimidine/phosphomethylpyrimidine kinase